MTHSINESINDKAVYRTAPATKGVLNILNLCNIFYFITGCNIPRDWQLRKHKGGRG